MSRARVFSPIENVWRRNMNMLISLETRPLAAFQENKRKATVSASTTDIYQLCVVWESQFFEQISREDE
ncbi:hypothetical protein GBAR_LOCUS11850 [Geodia barretti]|uniref:Uncharacterized protein n=1 Tax=Geodia barretti TaxID=519541 RepID=A0AA35S044_GEOBA|nr:hypothetical protein GBAR_LOCUS11850 [Geodia barretti]